MLPDELTLHRIIVGTIEGDDYNTDQLFKYVCRHVDRASLPQLGPYANEPSYRNEVAVRTMSRLLIRRCRRLRYYLDDPGVSFSSLLSAIVARVTADLARSINQAVRAYLKYQRANADGTGDHSPDPDDPAGEPAAAARLRAVAHILSARAHAMDIELCKFAHDAPDHWLELARALGVRM